MLVKLYASSVENLLFILSNNNAMKRYNSLYTFGHLLLYYLFCDRMTRMVLVFSVRVYISDS